MKIACFHLESLHLLGDNIWLAILNPSLIYKLGSDNNLMMIMCGHLFCTKSSSNFAAADFRGQLLQVAPILLPLLPTNGIPR